LLTKHKGSSLQGNVALRSWQYGLTGQGLYKNNQGQIFPGMALASYVSKQFSVKFPGHAANVEFGAFRKQKNLAFGSGHTVIS